MHGTQWACPGGLCKWCAVPRVNYPTRKSADRRFSGLLGHEVVIGWGILEKRFREVSEEDSPGGGPKERESKKKRKRLQLWFLPIGN